MATLGTNFPYTLPPISNVTPFTYRDGATYLEILNGLKDYINQNLRTEFNEGFNELLTEFQAGILNAETTITDLSVAWTEQYDAFIANFTDEIAVLSAAAVTGMVEDAGTVRTALITLIDAEIAAQPKSVDWVSVMNYGAVGDGVVDDTTAIQAAADAAYTMNPAAVLYMPAKTFLITGTVTIRNPLDASEAVLNYPGDGTALIIGSNVAGAVTARRKYRCPAVVHTSTTKWDGTSIGILAVNLNACELVTPFIQEFEYGLVCMGKGQGFAYTTVFPQSLWGNHKNLVLDQDDTGWCNSNTFNGGRFAQSNVGVTVNDTEYVHVYGVAPGSATSDDPNNNTFVGCSFEADNRHYYRAVMAGYANAFLNCRWEALGGSVPRILWKDGAANNRIVGGYDANKIVEIYEGTFAGGPSAIQDNARIYCKATDVSAPVIPTATATTLTGWTSFLGHRITYNNATGEYTPRYGKWVVNAKVSFAGQTVPAGYLQAQLMVGATILDIVRINPGTQINTIKLSGSHNFNGTDTFKVVVTQTSGADLSLVSTTGFTTVEANYYPA